MKLTRAYFKLASGYLLFCFSSLICSAATSDITTSLKSLHQEPEVLHTGSYLVIGVFQYETNASRFTENAIKEGLQASYKYHQHNQLIYVYSHYGETKNNLLPQYHQLRESTQYKDAWILNIDDNVTIVDLVRADSTTSQNTKSKTTETSKTELTKTSRKSVDILNVAFRTFDTTGSDTVYVNAQVQVVDGKHAELIEKTDSERGWAVDLNAFNIDTIQIIAEAVGYRKTQIDLNIKEQSDSLVPSNYYLKQDTLFVDIGLKSLGVGDYQVMYNTYFYGNSTVMRALSKYELENVYQFLQANPNIRICLHGHTNGNSRGLAYLFLEETRNFFEIIRTKEYRKRGVSSTKLSHYRAETIKSYLVSRGIEKERLKTKGWGGEKMLIDKDSPMASNNIRVEIEVLSK
ncbi:outer membrane protein OmpA-like peptidoglycan-associated protein [Catalinimonas alkaloidigena]|uniref:OmpA family protein n=1 Tax=Catalinimonas alkaloidigena TaxID=1075417 RepID=UPI002405F8CE|nr:OmpA family protein [Catalinimonas alkaloidigena]MDF9796905.1 outer membrane protein OmpA-like peptidoglycan-associated protein [Catalinimonas alkaloidigena]